MMSYACLQAFQVIFPSGVATSFGSAVALAALPFLGTDSTILAVAVGSLLAAVFRRAVLDRLLMNFGLWVTEIAFAGLVFLACGGNPGGPLAANILALLTAVAAHTAIDTLLAALLSSFYKGRSLFLSFSDLGAVPLLVLLTDACSVPLALMAGYTGVVSELMAATAASILASALLQGASRRSQRRMLSDLVRVPVRTALPGLAHREPAGGTLVQTVAELARAAGLGSEDSDALLWAALFHDSGLDEAALEASASAEPLAPEQLRHIREHPLRASLKVGRIGNLLWVARVLETHHEQYSGGGYPFGLKGEEIPLAAALLGLAEAYLALTTPRPYRPKARSPAEALRELKKLAGEQYSPAAVAALEKCVNSGALTGAGQEAAQHAAAEAVRRLRRSAGTPRLPRYEPGAAGSSFAARSLAGRARWFLTRLLAWNPLHAISQDKDLPADWYRSFLDLSQVFSSSLDVGVIAQRLADAVHDLTTFPCIVHLTDESARHLRPAAVSGMPAQAVENLGQPVDEGLLGLAIAERRAVTSLNLSEDPRSTQHEMARRLGVKSAVCVPLLSGEKPLGGFSVNAPVIRRFPPAELRALSTMANLAALALHNAFLYREASLRLDQLIETQMFLNTVFDTVPAGIFTLDTSGRLTACNRQASRYLRDLGLLESGLGSLLSPHSRSPLHASRGVEAGPAQGSGPNGGNLVEGLRRVLGTDVVRRVSETGRAHGPETVSATLPAGERFFEVWAAPLERASGASTGLLLVLDDVTAAKNLATEIQRKEKLAAIGEVAARAAHEIKNPLASIRGLTQLMGLYCPVREQWDECPKYVGLVTGEVDRLTEIAQSMLTLARPAQPKPEPADLVAVAGETVDLFAGKASEQGTTLELAAGSGSLPAEFDPRQIKQVVMNLVQNALDAVAGLGGPPPGWRKVTVSTGFTRRGSQRYAFIQVRDNGPGIRVEDRARVFTPFFTTKETGTGLGLPISKSIVEAHGGSIEARPAHGRGCVFEVLLPVSARGRARNGNGASSGR